MRFDAAQTIKDRLAMREVLEHYGYEPNRAKFICCPFHSERTPSMKIYEKDYHCFGCGANGDVISFVQKLFNLSFPETLKKIDNDFGLNLYGRTTFETARKSHWQSKSIQAQRQREKADRERNEAEYDINYQEWERLRANKKRYAPKTPDEELHPLFIEALQNLSYCEHLLDCAEEMRAKN